MARSCGRPGCSEPGAVAYGLAPRLLLAWLAPLGSDADTDTPVLCQRHADRTTVPNGWSLDDRREITPRLFRPPPAVTVDPSEERLAPVVELRPRIEVETPALPLDLPVAGPVGASAASEVSALGEEAEEAEDVEEAQEAEEAQQAQQAGGDVTPAMTGVPQAEVGGLLLANSPLLARAFHGRPRS